MTPIILISDPLSPEAMGERVAAIASVGRYTEGVARAGGGDLDPKLYG